MVDLDERQAVRERKRLREIDCHEQGADEPRVRGDGNAVERVRLDTRHGKCFIGNAGNRLNVRPPGDFGDDPAEAAVRLHLARDDVR